MGFWCDFLIFFWPVVACGQSADPQQLIFNATDVTTTRTTLTTSWFTAFTTSPWDLSSSEKAQKAAKAVLQIAEEAYSLAVKNLLAQAPSGEAVTKSTFVAPDGAVQTVAVIKLPAQSSVSSNSSNSSMPASLTLEAEPSDDGFVVSASIPLSVLASLASEGSIAVAMGSMSKSTSAIMDAASGQDATRPVSITLYGPGGEKLEGLELDKPIVVTVRANTTKDDVCVFWNETLGGWSQEGLTRVVSNLSDLEGSANLSAPLECATTHLSIFAAVHRETFKNASHSSAPVLGMLLCLQRADFNITEIVSTEILHDGVFNESWREERFTRIFFGFLSFFVVTLLWARLADFKGHPALHAAKSFQRTARAGSRKTKKVHPVSTLMELMGVDCSMFPELHHQVCDISMLPLKLLVGLIGNAGIQRRDHRTSQYSRAAIKEKAQDKVFKFLLASAPEQILQLFFACHRLLSLQIPRTSISATARAGLACSQFLCAAAVGSVLFRLMGILAKDVAPECHPGADLADRMIQVGAISTVCYSCSGVLWIVLFLLRRQMFHTRCVSQCCATAIEMLKQFLFWVITLACAGLCVLVIFVYLANVHEEYSWRWLACICVNFAFDFLVFPFCLAVVLKISLDLTFQANRDKADRLLNEVFHVSKAQADEHSHQLGVWTVEDLLGGPAQQEHDAVADDMSETSESTDEQYSENDLPPLFPLDISENAELQNAEHQEQGSRMDMANAMIDMLDLNNDGEVDREEIKLTVDVIVEQLDQDGDNELSVGELAEVMGVEAASAMVSRYDLDGDGKITKENLMLGYELETHKLSDENKKLLLELGNATGRTPEDVHQQLKQRIFSKMDADAGARLRAEHKIHAVRGASAAAGKILCEDEC
eukprot:TRINITY_DN25638_c0_g1_i1.p1 TRINITY_DN25638_c0_g1~~TRINITY_DN25638_c0_g1_i1.p1  ORF type:complete len:882 (+),score=158.18 TRINITY_DN25638_c0_g1_i1:88-2733(+)